MALIDLRQIKNGVQLQNDVTQAKSDITRIEGTVIPGVKNELNTEIAKKATKEELSAEQQRVDEAIALKADKSALTAEQERVNTELAKKAVKADVDLALEGKVDNSAFQSEKERVDLELGKKAVKSEVESSLAGKVGTGEFEAEKLRVDGELALKATKEEMTAEQSRVNGELAKKAEKTYVDTELDKKAVKLEVEASLALKADQATVTSELAKKANADEVTLQLAGKANVADVEETINEVNTEVAKKADKTYVDGELAKKATTEALTLGLAGKADSVHRHNVSDIDGLGTVATLNVGTAQGNVPVLGLNGKLDEAVLPSIAVNEFHVVANQDEAMRLTVENGDLVHIDPTAGGVLLNTQGSGTFICVNATEDTFEKRFRPLNSVADSITRAEVISALGEKADKTELTAKVEEVKGFATSEAERAAGVVDGKLTAAKGELESSIAGVEGRVGVLEGQVATKAESSVVEALSGKVTVNEGAIATANEKISANEQAIEELRQEVIDMVVVESSEVFVATENQKQVTIAGEVKEEASVKVYVNGFKLYKAEYSVAGKTVTLNTETIGYEMGEGFVIEVVYC